MQQNNELIKQLDFILNMVPKVFMNTPLELALDEIKKLKVKSNTLMEHLNTPIMDKSNQDLCAVCKKNKYSQNYSYDGHYVCSDCYFDMLGDLVESHSIGR